MIAICATDRKLTASMDLRFGRCPYFLITDGETTHFVANPYAEGQHEVAPHVVELLKKHQVTKVVTGEVGPKAKINLEKHKIQVIMLSEDKISLQFILKKMNLLR